MHIFFSMANFMRYLAALCLFLSPLLAAPALADASDISAASRSVVRVIVYSSAEGQQSIVSIGSGVVVARDKIVTNAHVVEMASMDDSVQIVIVPSDGTQSYRARVSASLPGKDLALLQLTSGALVPASIFAGTPEDGADVFAIGYPASVDVALEQSEADVLRPQQPVKTRGTVSSGRTSKSVESLLHTAPIAPGNSGGPLLMPADGCWVSTVSVRCPPTAAQNFTSPYRRANCRPFLLIAASRSALCGGIAGPSPN
jgi:S1-C subfamily serine protease